MSGIENFPGELDTLRADNARLRRLLRLSEEQARAAAGDQVMYPRTNPLSAPLVPAWSHRMVVG